MITRTHDAMATTFTVTAAHPDPAYAAQAIAESFAELDQIESRLSRFVQGSDIFRINRLHAGDSILVHRDTIDCLTFALEAQQATDGAFDITWSSTPPDPLAPRFAIALPNTIHMLQDEIRLDLGAIGKGFALDRVAAILRDWDIPSALLAASTSTLLALSPPPSQPGWPVQIGDGPQALHRHLALTSLSSSGRCVQGNHIIHPQTHAPATLWSRTWSTAPTAALSDALSTAFMLMDEQTLSRFCHRHPNISAYTQKDASSPLQILADHISRPM